VIKKFGFYVENHIFDQLCCLVGVPNSHQCFNNKDENEKRHQLDQKRKIFLGDNDIKDNFNKIRTSKRKQRENGSDEQQDDHNSFVGNCVAQNPFCLFPEVEPADPKSGLVMLSVMNVMGGVMGSAVHFFHRFFYPRVIYKDYEEKIEKNNSQGEIAHGLSIEMTYLSLEHQRPAIVINQFNDITLRKISVGNKV